MEALTDATLATCDLISCDIHEDTELFDCPVISLPDPEASQSSGTDRSVLAAVGLVHISGDDRIAGSSPHSSRYGIPSGHFKAEAGGNLFPTNSEADSDCSESMNPAGATAGAAPCMKKSRGRPKGTTVAAGFRVSGGRPARHRIVSATSDLPSDFATVTSGSDLLRKRQPGKRGRPKGSTAANGYKVSSGRPKGTTRQNGFKVSNGRPSTKLSLQLEQESQDRNSYPQFFLGDRDDGSKCTMVNSDGNNYAY